MKQTLETAAINELFFSYACTSRNLSFAGLVYDRNAMLNMFRKGAEWHAKQSPWIRVEERLPDEEQRVLVGFLYYYKYDDREAESRKHIDVFTYENGIWTTDSDISYLGKVSKRMILRLYVGCLFCLSMKYWKPTEMY